MFNKFLVTRLEILGNKKRVIKLKGSFLGGIGGHGDSDDEEDDDTAALMPKVSKDMIL